MPANKTINVQDTKAVVDARIQSDWADDATVQAAIQTIADSLTLDATHLCNIYVSAVYDDTGRVMEFEMHLTDLTVNKTAAQGG